MWRWKLIVGLSMAKCSTKSSKTSILATDAGVIRLPTKRLMFVVSLACVSRTALDNMSTTGMARVPNRSMVVTWAATGRGAAPRGPVNRVQKRVAKRDVEEPGCEESGGAGETYAGPDGKREGPSHRVSLRGEWNHKERGGGSDVGKW